MVASRGTTTTSTWKKDCLNGECCSWVTGDTLRAECESVVLAEYRCRYDWQAQKLQDIRGPVFYQTRVVSEGELMPWNERKWLVVYRPSYARQKTMPTEPARQLSLFELVSAV
jgi:hypothetical protein